MNDRYLVQVKTELSPWRIYGSRASLVDAHDTAEDAVKREDWDYARVRYHRETLVTVTRANLGLPEVA